ncbi:MAG: hypothetical protein WCF69_07585 [Mycobacterium sp.]
MTRRNGSRNRGNANRNVVRLKSQRAARRDSREDTHSVGTRPYRPIGLLGAILRWHGQLDAPPAALERARDAAERARRLASDERDRTESQRARANAATAEQRAAAKRLFASLRSTAQPPGSL